MRYILDDNGYIYSVSCNKMSCGTKYRDSKNICPTDVSKWERGHYGSAGQKEEDWANGRMRLIDLIPVIPNTKYYVTTNTTPYKFVIRGYDENKNFKLSYGACDNGWNVQTNDVYYLGVSIYNPNRDTATEYQNILNAMENGTIKPFICLESETDKTYEPYGKIEVPITCTEYTGAVPEGYDTLQEWATTANIRAYKIVNNNLVYDEAKASELEAEWTGCVDLSKVLNEGTIESYLLASNGYVRYTNGFQIAWNSQRVTAGGTAWSGTSVYYSDHSMGNWTQPFKTCYIVNHFCNNSTFWTSIANASATSGGNLRCFRPNNGTAETLIGVIGFGKWK